MTFPVTNNKSRKSLHNTFLKKNKHSKFYKIIYDISFKMLIRYLLENISSIFCHSFFAAQLTNHLKLNRKG